MNIVNDVLQLSSLTGSSTNMVVASSTGILSTQSIPSGATGPTGSFAATFIQGFLTSGPTASDLTQSTNWSAGGTYSGPALTNTYQGQQFYGIDTSGGSYVYEAIADNSWVRWNIGQGVVGSTGATGAASTVAGPTGPTGATGPAGSGATGPAGSATQSLYTIPMYISGFTFSMSNGYNQLITLTNSGTTMSMSGWANGDWGTLEIVQPSTGGPNVIGSFTASNGSFRWPSGTYSYSTANNAVDIWTIFFDGSYYSVTYQKNFLF